MHIEIANTILYCRRWRECVAFYRDRLALPVSFENEWFVEFELNPGARVSVADSAKTTIESAQGRGLTLTLKVADLQAARAELEGRGLSPGSISQHPWGASVFYLADPEGRRIEFWSNPDAG